jgi:peptidoglycan/LPS O-acetylase OafA/YrhL
MLFWGEASYSLYILHALVMWQVQAWLPARPWLREGTAIMTMLLASAICHRFVELPMRQRLLGWLRLCRTVIHHDSVPSRARAA